MRSEREGVAKAEFEKAYGLYAQSIFNFCLSRLSGDVESAEDCTQETFIVFYNRLKKGESFEVPRAFLYKTAVNIIMRHKTKLQKRAANETALDEKLNVTDEKSIVESNIDYDSVMNRISELLTAEEMKLFSLYFLENVKVKDISLMLNISPTACSTRLSRLRSKIKDGIKDFI